MNTERTPHDGGAQNEEPDPHGWGSFYPVRIFRAFSQARSARMGLFLIDGMSGTAAPL